jgi:hypothetical protein
VWRKGVREKNASKIAKMEDRINRRREKERREREKGEDAKGVQKEEVMEAGAGGEMLRLGEVETRQAGHPHIQQPRDERALRIPPARQQGP